MNITLAQLESVLKKVWSKETCYFKSLEDRKYENPCIGHCTITALIVQDYFWGDIVFCNHQDHYRNKLPNGEIVDMTKNQMWEKEICCVDEKCDRTNLLENHKSIQAKTKERYLLLKHRVTIGIEELGK